MLKVGVFLASVDDKMIDSNIPQSPYIVDSTIKTLTRLHTSFCGCGHLLLAIRYKCMYPYDFPRGTALKQYFKGQTINVGACLLFNEPNPIHLRILSSLARPKSNFEAVYV